MISYTALNIIIGGAAGIIVGGLSCLFVRKLGPIIGIAIIAFIIGFGFSRVLLTENYKIWTAQAEIDQIPIMSTIKKNHPKAYAVLMDEVAQSVKTKDISRNMLAYSYVVANRIFLSDLKSASDDSIYAYLQALKNGYIYLYKKDPALVYKMEHPDLAVVYEVQYLRTDAEFSKYYDAVMKAKRLVIQSAVNNPVATPVASTAAPMLEDVLNQLKAKYGAQAVDSAFNISENNVPAKVKGQVIIDFYQTILNMNKSHVGTIMRYIGLLSEQGSQQ